MSKKQLLVLALTFGLAAACVPEGEVSIHIEDDLATLNASEGPTETGEDEEQNADDDEDENNDEEGVEQPTVEDEAPLVEEDAAPETPETPDTSGSSGGGSSSSPDLACADDPSICRFCGPAVDVVTSCPASNNSFECQVFRKINEIRAEHGLVEVTYNATLAESAMIHAMDLSYCDYFAHNSLDGTTFFERCAANGYPGNCSGENIGGGQRSPQAVVDAWMASPSHRQNILHPPHRELGVAYHEGDGSYGRYWLKHFGRP